MRRAHATGINIRSLMPVLMWFSSAVKIEELHPLQWGIFRVKYRKDRRPGFPVQSPLSFYAGYAAETARKATKLARRWMHLKSIVAKIEADPNAKLYQDEALIPVTEEDAEHMELYTQSETVRAAVQHERRVAGHHHTNGHAGNGHAANGQNGNGLKAMAAVPATMPAITITTTTIRPTSRGQASFHPRLELHFVMLAKAGIQYSPVSQCYRRWWLLDRPVELGDDKILQGRSDYQPPSARRRKLPNSPPGLRHGGGGWPYG